jgi:hypothetical protein
MTPSSLKTRKELPLGLDLDLVRAQVVGDLEREVARGDGRAHLGGPAGAQDELGRHPVPAQALRDQLVEADLLEGNDLQPVDRRQARNLERADVDGARPVPLEVDERVRHRDRHLVAQLGGADGVSEDEDVRHGSRW